MIKRHQLRSDLVIYVPVTKEGDQLQLDPAQITYETQYVKAVVHDINPDFEDEIHIHVTYEPSLECCEGPDKSFLELCFLEKPVPPMEREKWSARARFLNLEIRDDNT